MTEYGGGIYLTSNFDFEVDNSGDIRGEFGVSELEKDIAFNIVQEMQNIPGRRKTQKTVAIVRNRTVQQLRADPRVNSILGEVDVFYPDQIGDVIEVAARVDTVDGEQQLVFPVGERE